MLSIFTAKKNQYKSVLFNDIRSTKEEDMHRLIISKKTYLPNMGLSQLVI